MFEMLFAWYKRATREAFGWFSITPFCAVCREARPIGTDGESIWCTLHPASRYPTDTCPDGELKEDRRAKHTD